MEGGSSTRRGAQIYPDLGLAADTPEVIRSPYSGNRKCLALPDIDPPGDIRHLDVLRSYSIYSHGFYDVAAAPTFPPF